MLKKLCQCLGLASLILVINYGDLLGGGSDVRMHTPFPVARICYAQIADILIVAALLFLVLACALAHPFLPLGTPRPRHPDPALPDRAHPVLLPLRSHPGTGAAISCRLGRPAASASAALSTSGTAASCAWPAVSPPRWWSSRSPASANCSGSPRWKPAPNQIDAAWETTAQPPRQHPLLVWIVFDELSYDQVFEHRARDLNLPNFDALRSQSTLFTHTQPAGYHTVEVLPSLLTGKIIDSTRYNFHNRLWVHHEGERVAAASMAQTPSSATRRAPDGAPLPSAGTTPTAPSTATPSKTATGPTTTCSTA